MRRHVEACGYKRIHRLLDCSALKQNSSILELVLIRQHLPKEAAKHNIGIPLDFYFEKHYSQPYSLH